MSLIISLIFAACVGYVAGQFMGVKGAWYINVILGLAGGLVGNLVFGLIGLNASSIIGDIIVSVIGSCIVIFAYNKLKK